MTAYWTDEALAQIEVTTKAFRVLAEAIAEILTPSFEAVVEKIKILDVTIRRQFLSWKLQCWLPRRVAAWLAWHWPERWLPSLDGLIQDDKLPPAVK